MSNHFNELLLQTLKDIGIRLERLEGRVDHVINEKADKTDVKDVQTELKAVAEKLEQKADKADVKDVKVDVKDVQTELKAVAEKLEQKADKADVNALHDEVRSHGQRLDRIETGIKTLQWTMTAGLAVLGIILAFIRSC